ncbi:MAG: hypothetical protein PUD47_07270 [Bacteroidales bacterium]|nr:hypothetical protein [Bacteroidales bacterium]
MKKVFMMMATLFLSLNVFAFEFDGIDLNGKVVDITRQISQKGYIYDDALKCLKGNCQGNEIYLTINNTDVTEKNRLGQLIVDVPMPGNAYVNVVKIFDVVYHRTDRTADTTTYSVSEDGTMLVVSATGQGVRLTYNTPYYKVKK